MGNDWGNQPVSYGVYLMAIVDACNIEQDFIDRHLPRIHLAYKMGEPIAMIADELKLRYSLRRPAPTETPRQLAVRVVRS